MTGFGSGRASNEAGSATVQVAVVNHRHCQIQVRCEPRDVALENHLRTRARDRIRRGSATLQFTWESAQALGLDRAALAAAWKELAMLAAEIGAPVPVLEQVARLQQRSGDVDVSAIMPQVDAALDQALDGLEAMRRQEGAALAVECERAIDELVRLRDEMEQVAGERLASYRDALLERVRDALADRQDISAEDVVREVALHADRIDVREELVRLVSHLDQLRGLLGGDQAIGKKVEFLLQEVGREINTTGSKANDAALTALVCEAKHVAEQLREQVANVL